MQMQNDLTYLDANLKIKLILPSSKYGSLCQHLHHQKKVFCKIFLLQDIILCGIYVVLTCHLLHPLTVDSSEMLFHVFSIHCLSSASDSLLLFPPVLVGSS